MSGEPKSESRTRGFLRTLRVYFRRFRILSWLLILLLLGGIIHLNQVGVPDFIKRPLLRELKTRGIDLQFSTLRLRWYEGLVAEDVRFGGFSGGPLPSLTAKEVKLMLGWRALLKGRAQVEALMVRGGTFTLPVADETAPGRALMATNIQTQLRLLPRDEWALDQFRATLANAQLRLSARIQNASVARDWPLLKPQPERADDQERFRRRVKALADTVDRINFHETPVLSVAVEGDAKDPRSFSVRIDTAVGIAESPWGNVTNGQLHVRLHPSRAGSDFTGSVELDASEGSSRWGSAKDFRLGLELAQADNITNSVQAALSLSAASARTPWASGSNVQAQVRWLHSLTNPVPLWATGAVACADVRTKWASASRARLRGALSSTNGASASAPPEWAWWTNLAPYVVRWDCEVEDAKSYSIEVRHADLAGAWETPRFTIESARARLYDGSLDASGSVDVNSREARVTAKLDFDTRKAGSILTEGARRWLSQLSWGSPPLVSAAATAILPAWTNRQPDWRGEVLPTLGLSGHLAATNGLGCQGIEADSVSSGFACSNMVWHLPDLLVQRPEGRLAASFAANDRTRDYYLRIHSTVDPKIIRPLLGTNDTEALDLAQFSSPPEIEAELWGNFSDFNKLGARALARATNFSFRSQSASRVEATVVYTNKIITVLSPVLERGADRATADAVVVDFIEQQVRLTNASGTFPPLVISHAIGQKVGKTMEAYIFDNSPRSRVYGIIPMHGEMGADLHFEVDGGPFHWWKFHVPRISGHVHWKDYQLSLANVDADFYQGKASGNAVIDVSDLPGTEFVFSMSGTNILLQSLLGDLTASPSKSEGWLSGTVVVTRANTDNWRTVQGRGQLSFRDGLLWDIPLFGIMSPVLDGLMPGLGSSRATEGSCSYVLTNGVFRTRNLDLRTLTMRLQYRGDVDLADDYKVHARVEAELLKDMWVVGPLVSTVLKPVTKLFEYKVEGYLGKPTLEPVNVIPKIIMLPFYPLRALRGFGTEPQTPPTSKPFPPAQKAN